MDFKRIIILKASFWITKPIDTDFSSLLPVSAEVTGHCLYYWTLGGLNSSLLEERIPEEQLPKLGGGRESPC